MRASTWSLPANPVTFADRRRKPASGPLPYFSDAQVEALAQAFESGAHRDPRAQNVGDGELAARSAEDRQDAELSALGPSPALATSVAPVAGATRKHGDASP